MDLRLFSLLEKHVVINSEKRLMITGSLEIIVMCVAVIFVYFHLLHSDQILFSKSDLSCLEGDCIFGMQD